MIIWYRSHLLREPGNNHWDKRRLIGLSTVSLPSHELPSSIEAEIASTHQIGHHHGDAAIDTQTTMDQNVRAVLDSFMDGTWVFCFFDFLYSWNNSIFIVICYLYLMSCKIRIQGGVKKHHPRMVFFRTAPLGVSPTRRMEFPDGFFACCSIKKKHFWLVVEPTHLKNISQNGFIFPKVRGEHKKYLSCHRLEFNSPEFVDETHISNNNDR